MEEREDARDKRVALFQPEGERSIHLSLSLSLSPFLSVFRVC